MQLKSALTAAEKETKKLHGYFLGSCFACIKNSKDPIDEWTLLYYNPSDGKAADCFVNEKFVTLSGETRIVKPVERMSLDEVHINIEKALEITADKFAKKPVNILITLHRRGHMLWTINLISADMNATTYDVDAKTGKILREETTSLIRKL